MKVMAPIWGGARVMMLGADFETSGGRLTACVENTTIKR